MAIRETDAVWDRLVDALGRADVVRLSPPGFGARLPGTSRQPFSPTVIGSFDELEAAMNRRSTSSDTTGVDAVVVNAVMHRPDLVRSWASDVVGLFDR